MAALPLDPPFAGLGAPPVPAELLARWRDLGMSGDARLGWALEQAALRRPDAVAVIDERRRVTFGELRDLSDAVAAQLLEAGVGAGDVVTFALPNVIETVAAAAAIWRIGAVSNPVVTLYREHEFVFILGQLRPAAVMAGGDIRGRNLCAEIDGALASTDWEPRLRLRFGGAPVDGWQASAPAPGSRGCLGRPNLRPPTGPASSSTPRAPPRTRRPSSTTPARSCRRSPRCSVPGA